jgi:Leucine-rich repeat (LRR) protein
MYRVTWFSTVLLGIILGFTSKPESASSVCCAQDNQEVSPNRRMLRFPSDQSVGVLRAGRFKGPSVVVDFEQIKVMAAKGNIEVSEEDFLELLVGSVDDLEFLEQLSPGALQGLTISGLEINRNALAMITRLEGLKCLRLNGCEFKKDTFEDAKSLSSLQAIVAFSSTVDGLPLDGSTFAGWIATLPKLEYLYARPSLDSVAYQKLSGHPALATTTIDISKDQTEWPLEQLRLPALRELIVNCDDKASSRALDGILALSNLESISISGGTVDGDLLKRIAALGSVRKLQLIYNKEGPGFLQGLETLQSLERLLFYQSQIRGVDPTLIKRQLTSSILKLPRIKTIPQIRKPSLQELEQIIARTSIESLDIDEWDDRVPTTKLAELSAHKELKTLKLSYVPITDSELQNLSRLEGLEELSLWNTEVQGHGLRLLSNLPKLRQMLITIDTRRVKPDLSGLSHLSQLERLQVFGYGFSSEDYFPITDCHSLRDVSISEGEINDALMTRLAKLPNLARINLSDSNMTDVGARALAQNQNLEDVVLAGAISRAAVAEFAKLPRLSAISIRSSELEPIDCVDLQFEFPSVGRIRFSRKER